MLLEFLAKSESKASFLIYFHSQQLLWKIGISDLGQSVLTKLNLIADAMILAFGMTMELY